MNVKTTIEHGKHTYHLSYDIGDTVEWESQAQGTWKEKRGQVIAFVPANTDMLEHIPPGTSANCVKGQRFSAIPRVLVGVPRYGRSSKIDYYAPHVKTPRVVEEG